MNQKISVIKIGTNVLTQKNGKLDLNVMDSLIDEISTLQKKGQQIVIITSGAIGFGKALFEKSSQKIVAAADQVSCRQIFSAVGQVELMRHYSEIFSRHGLKVAQVLATKQDFSNREHYLNMRSCFLNLLGNQIIPIVNENDTVAISELMFTDNDELAGLVASLIDAEKLIILTNVDGLYTGDPSDPNSKLISVVNPQDKIDQYIVASKSDFGRGGMQTKSQNALKLAKLGINVYFANGKKSRVIENIFSDKNEGTKFISSKAKSSVKRWIGFSNTLATGSITINSCTQVLLQGEKVISLLPIGIINADGDFSKGDLVKILNEHGQELGLGKAEYSAEELRPKLLKKGGKAFIHYDYMYIN